jgi:hypothetical protein
MSKALFAYAIVGTLTGSLAAIPEVRATVADTVAAIDVSRLWTLAKLPATDERCHVSIDVAAVMGAALQGKDVRQYAQATYGPAITFIKRRCLQGRLTLFGVTHTVDPDKIDLSQLTK